MERVNVYALSGDDALRFPSGSYSGDSMQRIRDSHVSLTGEQDRRFRSVIFYRNPAPVIRIQNDDQTLIDRERREASNSSGNAVFLILSIQATFQSGKKRELNSNFARGIMENRTC